MRLTRKTFFGDYALEEDNEKTKNTAFNKLGQLEDIEERLDIDLITLFKALNQKTLFVKTPTNIRETIEDGENWAIKAMMHEDGELMIFTNVLYPSGIGKTEWLTPIRLRLTDYGKTWALTKEELKMTSNTAIIEDCVNKKEEVYDDQTIVIEIKH